MTKLLNLNFSNDTVTNSTLSEVIVTVATALFLARSSVPREMLLLGGKVKFKVTGEILFSSQSFIEKPKWFLNV